MKTTKLAFAIWIVIVAAVLTRMVAEDSDSSATTRQVSFAALVQISSGPGNHILCEKGHEGTPFTGTAIRIFNDGRRNTCEIKNGKGNGLSILWYANGKKAMQVTLVDDKPDGVMIKWDANGQELSRTTYVNGKEVKADQPGAQPFH